MREYGYDVIAGCPSFAMVPTSIAEMTSPRIYPSSLDVRIDGTILHFVSNDDDWTLEKFVQMIQERNFCVKDDVQWLERQGE